MASRLICRNASTITGASLPNIRLLAGLRNFSSYDGPQPTNEDVIIRVVSGSDSSFRWPDTRLGLLEPKDHRFPLPGLVGSLNNRKPRSTRLMSKQFKPRYDVDVLIAELPHERQSSAYEQFMTVSKETQVDSDDLASKQVKSTPFDMLDCVAHDCPFLLRKDFFDMFPNCHLHPLDTLTVITFCQKPDAVDKTTDKLITDVQAEFLTAATSVCEKLHNYGFWADFIDPMSGRPYLGVQTNAAVYEVDDRYRRFGFEIDDTIEKCRVLRHHALGTRSFVGCVFTSAPVGHPLLNELVRGRNKRSTSN